MNFEVEELLKIWTEKMVEFDRTESERLSLGLLLEKMPEVINVPLSDIKVELRLGSGDDVLSTKLGTIWNLLRPSWCQPPHASLIEGVTERVRLSPAKDEELGNWNIVHKLILRHQGESEGAMSKLDKLVKKMEPGSCLDLACGVGEHSCDGRFCVRTQSFHREDLATWFGDITEKEKSEVQIVAECCDRSNLCLHNCKFSDGIKILFEDVQFTISRDAGVRPPFGDSVKRGVLARSVANDPEAYQWMEGWS